MYVIILVWISIISKKNVKKNEALLIRAFFYNFVHFVTINELFSDLKTRML